MGPEWMFIFVPFVLRLELTVQNKNRFQRRGDRINFQQFLFPRGVFTSQLTVVFGGWVGVIESRELSAPYSLANGAAIGGKLNKDIRIVNCGFLGSDGEL